MADEKVLRPKSFRLDDETADKFRKIGETIGANQQETLERLIQAYELQIGKSNLTEKKADMEKFESYIAILNRMYMASLEDNQHITDVVKESFEDALKSKDQTIQELQQQKKAAEETKQQATAEAKKATEEADQLRKALEETQKRCEELTADKETFAGRNKDLEADRSRLEAEVNVLEEAQQQIEALRRDLEAATAAKEAAERKLTSEREQMQFSLDKALLEANRKHQTEIQALKEEKQQAIDKYQEKCAALLEKLQDRKPEEVTTEK